MSAIRNNYHMEHDLNHILSKTDTFGRLVSHSSGKCFLYDCPYWSSKCSTLYFNKYPNALFTIEQNSFSLSGFIIVFEDSCKKNHTFRLYFSILLVLFTVILLYFWNYIFETKSSFLIQTIFNMFF